MSETQMQTKEFPVGRHGTIQVQIEEDLGLPNLLAACATAGAAAAARLPQLVNSPLPWSLTLRLGTNEDGRKLNRDFRGKDYATNVLSFPADEEDAINDGAEEWYVGDIFICTNVVAQEAAAQDKPVLDHLQHLVVHGVLHLGGYDHMDDEEAAIMEALEVEILAGLGIADPYADMDDEAPRAPDAHNG